MEDSEIYKKAAKRVRAKKGFFYHLIAYAGVLTMLYTLMKFENNGEMLPVMIVGICWGIGLATHYFGTFGTEHLDFLGFSSNWEEDELEKEIEKLTREKEMKERANNDELLLEDLDSLELKEIEKRKLDRKS